MFHLNHVVKVAKYHSVTVASPDTDVFVCTINHFKQLMFFDLNEFWFISDRSHSTTAVPIHDLVDHVNADVFDILPPVHALTGCDTISKIDAKTAAVNTANNCSYELICSFGKTGITDEIIGNAEKFLLKYISNQNLNEFDDTRYRLYYKKLHQFHLEKFIPVSSGIRQHILPAYLQCHFRLHAPFTEDIFRDPLNYGCMFNDVDHLAPSLFFSLSLYIIYI